MIFGGSGGGSVLIVSQEQSMFQLSHFAALTECLTCFSASIWHISQGEAGVGTEGSDLRGSVCERDTSDCVCVCEKEHALSVIVCLCVCVCAHVFLPVSCPVVGRRT